VALASDNTTNSNPFNVQGPVTTTVTVGNNPVFVGGRAATTSIAQPSTDGGMQPFMVTNQGKLVVALNGPRSLKGKQTTTLSTTTETTIVTAGAAGLFQDLTGLTAFNGSTQTVRVDIRDATAGSVVFSACLAANGGGFVFPIASLLVQTTAANNWTAQLSDGTTTNNVRINAVFDTTK
jgi:hypothetical protein